MKSILIRCTYSFVFLTVCTLLFTACNTAKQAKALIYMNDIADSIQNKVIVDVEPRIQTGDRLVIGVGALNAESVIPYNPVTSTAGNPGFLVDGSGMIQFPQLGKIRVAGYTRQELTDTLTGILKKFVMDPVVNVQLVNFKITVLGDVTSPGTKPVPEGKINLLEAIGISGDLTYFGRRDNILIIRENNGKREYGRVDLTSANLFSSPYYNLKQNDIVYVEMNKSKIESNDQSFNRKFTIATNIVTVAATIILLILNITNR